MRKKITKFCYSLVQGDYILQAPRLRQAGAKPDTAGASLWPNIILQDFIIKLLKLKKFITGQKDNIIFVIVNKFIKQEYFIIYIKEVFTKYKVLNKIILD